VLLRSRYGASFSDLCRYNVDDDTVVVFTADHGQNLGELNMWSMMNLLETSLRVPLMIRPAPRDGWSPAHLSFSLHSARNH
jgi:arylsulfatase A-like enzyme